MSRLIEKISYIVWGVKDLDKDKFYWRKTDNIMCRRTGRYCANITTICSECVMIYYHEKHHPCGPPVIWEKSVNPDWRNYPELSKIIEGVKILRKHGEKEDEK